MSSLLSKTRAISVSLDENDLSVDLSDGRVISVPLAWYPRLHHGTPAERSSWRLIGGGLGIHWDLLDEDISIKNLLLGQPAAENPKSLERSGSSSEAIIGPKRYLYIWGS